MQSIPAWLHYRDRSTIQWRPGAQTVHGSAPILLKGLILRLKNPGDTRAHLISPTEKGRKLIGKAIKIVEDTDSAFFAILDDNMSELTEMLRKLISSN